MIIDDIKYNEKNSLFEIHISNNVYSISYNLYEELELKVGKEISNIDLDYIVSEDCYQNAKKIASNFINYKFRTEREVSQKLRIGKISEEIIIKVIEHFKNLDLINDERYAEQFIEHSFFIKNMSISSISQKLYEKGIKKELSRKFLDELDKNLEIENAEKLFKKKYSNKDLTNRKERDKAIRYLVSKGFNFDIIKKIIGENI